MEQLANTGIFTCTQPGFSDLSGSASQTQLPNTIVYNDQANTYSAGPQSLGSQALSDQLANATVTGTTLNKLAKMNGQGSVVITAISDTSGALGVVVAGAGTSGSADVAQVGQASCVFDGATTAGDFATISSTTAGDCHDFGASAPTTSQAVGRVLSTNASAGTYAMQLLSGGGGGSGSGTVNSGSSGQLGYYASTGTAISGNANATISGGTETLGVAGTTAGALALSGSTSGAVTLNANASTTSYSLTMPAAQGTGALSDNGSGVLSWSLFQTPLTFSDSLVNTSGTVTLVGDSASPGNYKLYGTNGSGTLGFQAATTAPTASAFAGWDANSNLSANNFISGYATTATAGGTTTLTVSSPAQQFFTGTSTQVVQLPVVSTLALGQSYSITNNSTGAVTINSSGGNFVAYVTPGQTVTATCVSTSGTDASSWSAPNMALSQVAQARWLGDLVYASGSGTWTVTATGFTAPSNGSASAPTISGQVSDPGNKELQVSTPNVGAGTITVDFSAEFGDTATSTIEYCELVDESSNVLRVTRMNSNDNNGGGYGSFPYTLHGSWNYTEGATHTFTVECKVNSGSTLTVASLTPGNDEPIFDVSFKPSRAQTVAQAATAPASWSGYQTVSGASWNLSSTTFSDFSAGTSVVTTPLQNINFGTVSNISGSLPGITFTPPTAGVYHICAYANAQSSAASEEVSLRLVDSSSNVINPGMTITTTGGSAVTTFPLCGNYNVTSTSPVSVKVQGAAPANAVELVNGVASGSAAIQWTISQLDSPTPTPYYMGNVSSTTSGMEHVERVSSTPSCTSSPCAITSQSGSWVTSITRNSVGNYTVNIASGEFSAAPTCTVTLSPNGSAFFVLSEATTSTSLSFNTVSQSPANADNGFFVICMGPR